MPSTTVWSLKLLGINVSSKVKRAAGSEHTQPQTRSTSSQSQQNEGSGASSIVELSDMRAGTPSLEAQTTQQTRQNSNNDATNSACSERTDSSADGINQAIMARHDWFFFFTKLFSKAQARSQQNANPNTYMARLASIATVLGLILAIVFGIGAWQGMIIGNKLNKANLDLAIFSLCRSSPVSTYFQHRPDLVINVC